VLWPTVGEGLAQGFYVAARDGFEPATFRTQGTEPPNPTYWFRLSSLFWTNLNASVYLLPS